MMGYTWLFDSYNGDQKEDCLFQGRYVDNNNLFQTLFLGIFNNMQLQISSKFLVYNHHLNDSKREMQGKRTTRRELMFLQCHEFGVVPIVISSAEKLIRSLYCSRHYLLDYVVPASLVEFQVILKLKTYF